LVSPYVVTSLNPKPSLKKAKKVLTWCGKFYWPIAHFGKLFYLLVCENAIELFTPTISTLWVWKWIDLASPWIHARVTSGKGLPFPRRTQQTNKLLFFGGEMNRSFCKSYLSWAHNKFCNWALILKNTQRFQPPTKCGVLFVGGLWSLLLRTKFCVRDCWYLHLLQAVRKPKVHSFVCLFVWLIDWVESSSGTSSTSVVWRSISSKTPSFCLVCLILQQLAVKFVVWRCIHSSKPRSLFVFWFFRKQQSFVVWRSIYIYIYFRASSLAVFLFWFRNQRKSGYPRTWPRTWTWTCQHWCSNPERTILLQSSEQGEDS
jgi:hypothetical protein